MLSGSAPWAALILVCTSLAAPSIFLDRSNCMVMDVEPSELVEVMDAMPSMEENCCSRGVATDEAMVSGSAPGSDAETWMVGKSMLGISLMGRLK